MPNFKEFFKYNPREPALWMYAERQDVLDWLWQAAPHKTQFDVNDDLIVFSKDDFQLEDNVITALPVRLDTPKKLVLKMKNLQTLRGIPEGVMYGTLIIASDKLTELDYLPYSVSSLNIIDCPNVHSLHGIHDKVKRMTMIIVGEGIESSILGLLTIKDFSGMMTNTSNSNASLNKACQILNAAIIHKQDLLDCKAELIEKGLSTYAKL
jgi:hypothetical protein